VVVSSGDTMVLVTAVAEKKTKNMGFLPLTIEYQERMYAAGRIPGTCPRPRLLSPCSRLTRSLIRIFWP
jgi:polyribonucleotide nucleotidyltransferase